MSCRKATTAATYGMGFPAMFAPNTVGGHSICPRCMNFILSTCGALLSLPCVRGGAARSAAEGLFLTETIFLFCSAISKLLQSLRRSRASSLYTREPFLVCANIAGTYLAHRPGKI